MKSFIHLHTHSHFSLLTALPKIDELIEAAKEDGQTAIALTDNGNLYAAVDFFQKCTKADIKPIIGIDAYVAARTRHDKEPRIDNRRTRLILLAKNNAGYKNLIKLVTDSHLEGFYYKPRIDKELIEKYRENLICISPFFSSEISNSLKLGDFKKAAEYAEFYKKVFGEDFYLEVTHHPEINGMLELKNNLIKFAEENNLKLCAAHDVYYIKPEDREARETLVSVQNTFSTKDQNHDEVDDFSFISQKKANEYFKDLPEALENTMKIAKQCEFKIELGKWKFPKYEITLGKDADEELEILARNGIKEKKIVHDEGLEKRLQYELEIIRKKGYSDYFLVVADILRFARENHIYSNTRGSAAGSLVSYLAGITIVDPIKLNLPFERFLNPERPSAPDIDMDFADEKRDTIIEYVKQKYGADKVAQIGTFGSMLARGSVRDAARAMNFDYQIGDKIAKLIPMGSQGFPMTIERALKEEVELQDLYKKDTDSKKIIDMAKKIEGRARHIGVHAAGVVISPDPLTDDVPIQFDPKGEQKLITQYDMHAVGEDGVGLLKFDFLGLKNLTIMGNTVKLIKKIYGEDLDIYNVSLEDTKTYEMLARGETAATFQLNGQGMTKFLKDLKPSNINDINAMVALYRPGPMAFIPDYIERKHNPSKVKYVDDRFKEILEPTFGILIYQDDIMLLAVHFAGYSWGEADKFRKAMGKKIPKIMREQKEKFSKGCIEVGGLSQKQTDSLWESIETFAAYGFNKAHAASYGQIAYLTSYLKAHYPVLYMTAVLTADQGDVDKVAEMIEECKRMGVKVLAPDINESFEDFTVIKSSGDNFEKNSDNNEKGKENIRFGLTTIKNFGEGIAHEIIEERKKNGKFLNLEDFISRIHSRSFNKKSLEALIKTGALDSFGERGQLLENLESLLEYNKEIKNESKDQGNLFGGDMNVLPTLTLTKTDPVSSEIKLVWEKELLGLYISGHPLKKFEEQLKSKNINLKKTKENAPVGTEVLIAGHIDDVREIRTKKGDPMAFVKVTDLFDTIEVVFFPSVLHKAIAFLTVGNCIVVKGKISDRNGEKSVLADLVKKLE
jgi:DNA polymerase-3 subunit alpha